MEEVTGVEALIYPCPARKRWGVTAGTRRRVPALAEQARVRCTFPCIRASARDLEAKIRCTCRAYLWGIFGQLEAFGSVKSYWKRY